MGKPEIPKVFLNDPEMMKYADDMTRYLTSMERTLAQKNYQTAQRVTDTEASITTLQVSDASVAVRTVTSDAATGPNAKGGYTGNSVDANAHSSIVLGGLENNPNIIGVSFTGVYGGPNDTYIAGTASYSAILGGYDNVCNGLASWNLTQHGRIYTAAAHAALIGGSQSRIEAGSGSIVAGGTGHVVSANGDANGILGGISCTISGTAAGNGIVGGRLNTLSGSYQAAVGSYQCTMTAPNGGAAIGAQECTVSANFAVALGLQNSSYIQGGLVSGCRRHAANADSMAIDFHESQETLDAATTDLSPYGTANLVSLPINTTWVGSLFVVARQLSTGNRAGWRCDFVISKAGSGNIIVDAQNWTELFDNVGTGLANPQINPSGSSVFRVRCAGIASAGTIYWSSRISVVSCTGV